MVSNIAPTAVGSISNAPSPPPIPNTFINVSARDSSRLLVTIIPKPYEFKKIIGLIVEPTILLAEFNILSIGDAAAFSGPAGSSSTTVSSSTCSISNKLYIKFLINPVISISTIAISICVSNNSKLAYNTLLTKYPFNMLCALATVPLVLSNILKPISSSAIIAVLIKARFVETSLLKSTASLTFMYAYTVSSPPTVKKSVVNSGASRPKNA